jgi:hypothetical protein
MFRASICPSSGNVPETCWQKGRWINFICVASSWIITLPCFTMHGHMNVKFVVVQLRRICIPTLEGRRCQHCAPPEPGADNWAGLGAGLDGTENLPSSEIRSPDRPGHSQSTPSHPLKHGGVILNPHTLLISEIVEEISAPPFVRLSPLGNFRRCLLRGCRKHYRFCVVLGLFDYILNHKYRAVYHNHQHITNMVCPITTYSSVFPCVVYFSLPPPCCRHSSTISPAQDTSTNGIFSIGVRNNCIYILVYCTNCQHHKDLLKKIGSVA